MKLSELTKSCSAVGKIARATGFPQNYQILSEVQFRSGLTLHPSPFDTLAWYQSQGQDYQQRIRTALRLYAEAHRALV